MNTRSFPISFFQWLVLLIANTILALPVSISFVALSPNTAFAQACTGTNLMVNGDFESPSVPGANAFALFNQALVPGWSTNAGDGQIELWDSGHASVPSNTGVQHLELNGTDANTLTGTASINSRAEILFYWAHRARTFPTETVSLTISDNAGGLTNYGNFSAATQQINQLNYEFFDFVPSGNSVFNIPTTGPDFTGKIANFNVDALAVSLTGSGITYSIRYTGQLNIITAGTYTFSTTSDDGSALLIDGSLVVNNDGLHAARKITGSPIFLSAGFHSVEILFFENNGADTLNVEYSGPDTSNVEVNLFAPGNVTDSVGTVWNENSNIYLASTGASTLNPAFTSLVAGGLGNFLDSIEACQTYITLAKSELSRQDLDSDSRDSDGDTITYRYILSNPAGNERALDTVEIEDDILSTISLSGGPDSGDANSNNILDVGETWIVDRPYTLTQADIDAGSVTNIAFSEGSTPDNRLRSDDQTVTATLTSDPSILVTKEASAPGFSEIGGILQNVTVGTNITYTYTVENTGNLTMNDISLLETVASFTGTGGLPNPTSEILLSDNAPFGDSSDGDGTNGNWQILAPGDQIQFIANYIVTQEDIDTLQ